MNKEKTGALIAELRKEKGLTQEQLGEKLFVTDKAVSKWERGASAPGVDLLEKLAEVLGVTVTELLAGERVAEEERLDRAQLQALLLLRKERRRILATVAAVAAAVLLLAILVLSVWGPVFFQRGNPIPYIGAMLRLPGEDYVMVHDRSVSDIYLTRGYEHEALFRMIEETRGVQFREQMGSGWIFENGTDRLVVTSQIYWRYFVVWQVPTHTLQAP